MKLIVKYQNRKFYSKSDKRYTCLRELKPLFESGPVTVIDQKTNTDITAEVKRRAFFYGDSSNALL